MSDLEEEMKKLEEEMAIKGAKVEVSEPPTEPDFSDIEKALEDREKQLEEEPEFISPEEEITRRKKKRKIVLIVVIILFLIAAGAGGYIAYRILGPSTEMADLGSFFNMADDEIAIVIDTKLSDKKGKIIDGNKYIPEAIASSYMDPRIYVDTEEKLLSYATEEGVTDYQAGAETDGIKPLVESGGEFYVALSFISRGAICDYTEFDSPNRIAIFYDRTKRYSTQIVNTETYVRTGPGIKYPYVKILSEGEQVFSDESRKDENEFKSVMTEDGFPGYIPFSSIDRTDQNTHVFSKEPVSFTQRSFGSQVRLGWHYVGDANQTSLPVNMGVADSINVLSPTWITLKNNKGGIESCANKTYADSAHDAGLALWPTVRDFPNEKLKHVKLLGSATSRRRLIKKIMKEAKTYGFDGINIDFERVKSEAAKAYLQFLRELCIECHAADIILSSDNYPIREYNLYYNPEEQGRIVDYVFFMAYDEHYAGSEEAGSVSSLLYVQDAIAKALQRLPDERVAIGLPFYTRLWLEKKKGDGFELSSEVMTMGQAEEWIWSHGIEPKWDDATGQAYAEYKQNKKKTYRIWLENEKSLKLKLEEIKKQGVAGVGFWSMGSERAITWETIRDVLGK